MHRAGRTARAGRGGRALNLVTQYDVSLVHAIEEFTGVKWGESKEVWATDSPPPPLLPALSPLPPSPPCLPSLSLIRNRPETAWWFCWLTFRSLL